MTCERLERGEGVRELEQLYLNLKGFKMCLVFKNSPVHLSVSWFLILKADI